MLSQPNLGCWGHQTNGTQAIETGSYTSGGTQPASDAPESATIAASEPASVAGAGVEPQPVLASATTASATGRTSFFFVSMT